MKTGTGKNIGLPEHCALSVEMACLLGIQNEIQAVCYVNKFYMNIGDGKKHYIR